MNNVLPFRSVNKPLVELIEDLLQDAKDGKVKQLMYVYESNQNSCVRGKHTIIGGAWQLLGMLEMMKLDFWEWINSDD